MFNSAFRFFNSSGAGTGSPVWNRLSVVDYPYGAICMSADGSIMFASANSNQPQLSLNYGASWGPIVFGVKHVFDAALTTTKTVPLLLYTGSSSISKSTNTTRADLQNGFRGFSSAQKTVTTSYDGTKIIAGSSTTGALVLSTDFGDSFGNAIATGSTTDIFKVRCSSNAGTILAISNSGIFRSTNITSWTQVYTFAANDVAQCIAISADGSTAIAVSTLNAFMISTNGGTSWTNLSSYGQGTVSTVNAGYASLSQDGAIITICVDGANSSDASPANGIFVSFDRGFSWLKSTISPTPTSRRVREVVMSESGAYSLASYAGPESVSTATSGYLYLR